MCSRKRPFLANQCQETHMTINSLENADIPYKSIFLKRVISSDASGITLAEETKWINHITFTIFSTVSAEYLPLNKSNVFKINLI